MWIMCGFIEIASRRESTWDLSYTQVTCFGVDFAGATESSVGFSLDAFSSVCSADWAGCRLDDSPSRFSHGIIMVLHDESFSLYGHLKESFSACGRLIFCMSNEHMLLFLKPTG